MQLNKYNGTGTKRILVIAGVHGNELTPVMSASILERYLTQDSPNYSELTVINFVNEQGIRDNTREMPIQNDLNRMFKSDNVDIFETLKENIDNSDVVIDIHSSPLCTDFVLINRDKFCNSYVNFCRSSDIYYVIRNSSNDTIKKYCLDNDKIGFTIELNKLDIVDINSAKNGARIILKLISNVSTLTIESLNPIYSHYIEFNSSSEGIFIPSNKKLGDIVTNGDLIGDLILFNGQSEEIKYNGLDARIMFGSGRSYVAQGECIYGLQPIENSF
jgi:predicted deacylase